MTNVSLVLLDTPLVTTRSKTIPRLGQQTLSDFWAKQTMAVYQPNNSLCNELYLTKGEPSIGQLNNAILSSSIYKNNLLDANIHVLAREHDLSKHRKLFNKLSGRLPHNNILYHIITNNQIPAMDVLRRNGLRGEVATVTNGDIEQAVLNRNGLKVNDISGVRDTADSYILNDEPIESDDLVITTVDEFGDYYPNVKSLNECKDVYDGIVITNHTMSHNVFEPSENDQLLERDEDWGASFVDEYESGVNSNVVLILEPDKTNASSALNDWLSYIEGHKVPIMFFGWPKDASKNTIFPVGYSSERSRHFIESATELFTNKDVLDAWRYHHSITSETPRLTNWINTF